MSRPPSTSRRRKSRLQWRRRRPIFIASGSAISVAIASALSIANFAGVDLANAAVEKAKSLIEMMNRRSPGERVKGELTKTKAKHFKVLAEKPIPAVEMPVPPAGLADVFTPPVGALIPAAMQLPAIAQFVPPTPPGVVFVPPPGVFVPPCCEITPPPGPPPPPPGPPPPPPPGPPPPPPPPPPPVPEPSTWMTLVFGFGLSGWLLRRKRPERTKASVN